VFLAQGPSTVDVGRVTAVYWEEDRHAAAGLAEIADRAGPWPGIRAPGERRIRLLLAHNDERFDSLTRGRLPEWGVGAAFPAANTIVLNVSAGQPLRVLRHELAHLALHEAVRFAPRWFDEGYAARAAGEWDRLDALRLNWWMVRGRVPALVDLERRLRGHQAGEAQAAYALATSAVLLLERLGGERGLEPLITTLGTTGDFDRAMRVTYQMTLGQFEDRWQRELRQRYGWLAMLTAFTVFWAGTAVLLLALWSLRRRRDRERRAALDDGWQVPVEHEDTDA
jgi:hypothetical protein